MEMIGKAHVHWSTSSSGGRKGRRSRRHFSATLDFFRLQSVLLQERGGRRTDGCMIMLRTVRRCLVKSRVSPFCSVEYADKAAAWHACVSLYMSTPPRKLPVLLPWGLWTSVLHHDRGHPSALASLQGLCVRVKLRKSYGHQQAGAVGETVKIRCEFSNASSRPATPKAKLQQKQGFYTHNRVSQRIIYKTLASAAAAAVEPQTSDVLAEILLTIPDTTIATINNCSILEVEYVIELTLSQTASSDLTVLFPIIISDISVPNLLPPPYL
ncbi:uncharacterized protein ACBR49_000139 isoform 2-T2 [Aulostomus maculatus]